MNEVDVSDLQEYDVPDPPRPPRTWPRLQGIFAILVAGACALAYLEANRLQHIVSIFIAPYDGDADDALRRLRNEYDGEEILEHVLAMSSDADRGAFHEALAATGNTAHMTSIEAYVRDFDPWKHPMRARTGDRLEEALVSMQSLDPERTLDFLFELEGLQGDDSAASAARQCLETRYQPEDILSRVVLIEDPARRGGFHRALAAGADPAQIPAVLAHVEENSPGWDRGLDEEQSPDPYLGVDLTGVNVIDTSRPWASVAESLRAFGPAATEELRSGLTSEARSVVNLAAEVLLETDRPALIDFVYQLLDRYDEGYSRLAQASSALYRNEEGDPGGLQQLGISVIEAQAIREDAEHESLVLGEILTVLNSVPEDTEIDFCFIRGLSSFTQAVAEYCAETLEERLDPSELIDTLFSYIAAKEKFLVVEVDVYESIMRRQGEEGAKRIAFNLERLLDEAGDPELVFWLYKKMGFALLADLGGGDALPILRRYATDPGSYYLQTNSGEKSEIAFASACEAAIQAITERL